jgi:hypothetical protein
LSVTGAVDAVTVGASGGDRDGRGSAKGGEATVGVEAVGVVAGSAEQRADGLIAESRPLEQRCGDGVEDRLDDVVELDDLGVEGSPSPGDCGQSPLGGTSRCEQIARSVTRGDPDAAASAQGPQLAADGVGGGVDQAVELVGGRGPRLERTGAGDPQLAERFHGPVAGLGDHGGVTGEHSSRRGFCVDGVGLAAPTAGLTVRSVHLQHVEPAGPEVPAQSRSPGAGALDADGETSPWPVTQRARRR